MPDQRGQASNQSSPRARELTSQLAGPLRRYLQTESGSAGTVLVVAIIAMVWANSPFSESYESLWGTIGSVGLGSWSLDLSLLHWVNEGLMGIFFFVIGLEVRHEISVGSLRKRENQWLPLIAGIGGMIVPVLVFLAIDPSGDASKGWGIVIGTDTAFLLGALALVGPGSSTQLRVFLLAVTVVDDFVAVSVIGLVYSESINLMALAVAVAALAAFPLLSRAGAWQGWVFALFGSIMWVAIVESGLHPSIGGMAAGLLIGTSPPGRVDVERAMRRFRAFRQSPQPAVGISAKRSLERAVPLNERLQRVLHPLASYVIVPIFALANAGVDLRDGMLGEALSSPLTWGVVFGLTAGKLIGIGSSALGAVKLGVVKLPQGVGPGQVMGGAALSGIGFTVSLLIADLAFSDPALLRAATVGVLLAAVLSVLLGWIVFKLAAAINGETTASLPTRLSEPVDITRDHIFGRVDAPLTLIEYADFECPFCGRETGVVAELLERFDGELRYVFRHLPLDDVHPHATMAAQAAEAAAAQGHFWPMYVRLFDQHRQLERADLIGYASEIGLDVERFVRDLDDEAHDERVREDIASAEASGARKTPTFFIGERRLIGPTDAETIGAALEQLRREQKREARAADQAAEATRTAEADEAARIAEIDQAERVARAKKIARAREAAKRNAEETD